MTLNEKLTEINIYFNYWIGNYQRKDLTTNNVRIALEALAKACILKNKGEVNGTKIILGKDPNTPRNRSTSVGKELNLADLTKVLIQLNILKNQKPIELQFDLIRNIANKGSHSQNKPSDITTVDDLNSCNSSIKSIITWFYKKFLNIDIPQNILEGFEGKQNIALLESGREKFIQFQLAAHDFDNRRFQYIFVSPENLADDIYTVEAFSKLPWRLVIDFNPKSDEIETGLLHTFNRIIGSGKKKTFTINDKADFDTKFPHYWYMANGQGSIPSIADFKSWKSKYKRLSENLYQKFIEGSRVSSRIVIFVNIEPLFAEYIIDEFNRIDEENLRFILCSETESYENIFEKFDNVEALRISANEISEGVNNLLSFTNKHELNLKYPIPHLKEDKKVYLSVTQDHYDYLSSMGIELIFKGIESSIPSDEKYSFYRGSTITWRDLSEQKDIIRNSLESIQKRLGSKLQENKLQEIHLIHEAGAGGTTLARRIAYNFSTDYPTVVLKSYKHKKTIDALRIIYDQYTKGSIPILIVIESYEVKDSNLLYRDLSNAKKNAIILIVSRGVINNSADKKFVLKSQLEGNELNAFESTYVLLAPEQKESIKNIPNRYKDDPRYVTPVLYALNAFGENYNGLESYVNKSLQNITLEQKKFAAFLCIIYYYTQKSVPAEIFSSLFNVTRDKCNLNELLGKDNPLLEILHQEADTEEYYNIWRPRYALVGEEAMKIILGGGLDSKKNWKSNLANWLIDMIKYIRSNLEYLDTDTAEIFNSLFIERISLDDDVKDKEFTKAINDLMDPMNGVAIFEALTEAYPNEDHYHGHFARYLYSNNVGIKDYNRAIIEAELSLITYRDNSTLLHTLGMCYREKAENIIYTFEKQSVDIDIAEEEVKHLTEQACDIFDECIDVDPQNIYGYESQIRVILKTLDFGFKIHQASSKEMFITDSKNSWYIEKLDKVSRLLEEALFVIEQAKRVENKERIFKSVKYIQDCEALFFKTLGKNLTAKNKFEALIKNTPKGYDYMRSHYKRMFVMCLLASKVGARGDLYQAWAGISIHELNQCIQYLDENIFEDPANTQNIRLWLQAVRHTTNPPPIVQCIAKIGSWTQIIQQNNNSILEGYYYLYVLNSVRAISEGNTFDNTTVQIVKEIQDKMKSFVKNEKFCYEWFGKGNGIVQMVHHKRLGEFTADFFEKNKNILAEVTGRIKEVNSSQQGTIVLDCGLEAFFVPNVGGFTERNKNERVRCYIGFRYDQIQAWSVILYTNARDKVNIDNDLELKEYIEDFEGNESISIIEQDRHIQSIENVESPKLPGVVVLGNIDLSQKEASEVKKTDYLQTPIKGFTYKGIVKALHSNSGYITVSDLGKDVAFRHFNLDKCKFSDLKKGTEVLILIAFENKKAKTASRDRNYVAEKIWLH
ncbi:hypothetical protein [Chryseobacterium sp.]|uniref:hypothetical protein n=1 Tax=Chryseobacterium sp. TaxID=1871047 RepID=UPI0031E3DAE5